MRPLISVIVPVYKVEDYLDRCVESIVSQTYGNLEIVLVDDGSPDRCGAICDRWASQDGRIQVLHKKNGGLSDARNAGLSVANGEYICFVDSDDWVAPRFLERLLDAIQASDSDICECEAYRTEGQSCPKTETEAAAEIWQTVSALEQLIKDGVFHQYVWNKLYRRAVIGEIRFPVGKTNEDEFWTYQVFGRAKRIVKISDVLYNYFQRPGSIMNAGYSLKRLHALEAKAKRQHFLEKHFPQLASQGRINLIFTCVYQGQKALSFLGGEERHRAITYLKEILRSHPLTGADRKTLPVTHRIWYVLLKICPVLTFYIRNLLRIGV